MQVKVIEGGQAPQQPKPGGVGYDCFARKASIIHYGETVKIPLGFAAIPAAGCYLKLEDRPGLAARGLSVGGGIVEPGCRGELQAIVRNVSASPWDIRPGDKICQIVQSPFVVTSIELVDGLGVTERGAKGFGSSGR